MLAHTQTHSTDTICTLAFVGPTVNAQAAREALQSLGFQEVRETVPGASAFQLGRMPNCPVLHSLGHGQKKV